MGKLSLPASPPAAKGNREGRKGKEREEWLGECIFLML
jgi:hypothetical protein